jgi:cell division protein FtsL
MEEGSMKRGTGAIRMGIACALLFGSLSMVVWRQSRALEELRGLDAARAERTLLQAEHSELQRSIQQLESRTRIVSVARERFGLRTPAGNEIVFLRAPSRAVWDGNDADLAGSGLLTVAERP